MMKTQGNSMNHTAQWFLLFLLKRYHLINLGVCRDF